MPARSYSALRRILKSKNPTLHTAQLNQLAKRAYGRERAKYAKAVSPRPVTPPPDVSTWDPDEAERQVRFKLTSEQLAERKARQASMSNLLT